MKHIILISLAVLMFIIAAPRGQALFGHVAAEKDRREHVEQQFNQSQQQLRDQQQLAKAQQRLIGEQQQTVVGEQKLTSKWQTTALALGISSAVMLLVGTAIGSRGRHHATARK